MALSHLQLLKLRLLILRHRILLSHLEAAPRLLLGRELEHGVGDDGLADRAEATGAELVFVGLLDDVAEGLRREGDVDVLHGEELLVLLHKGVLRLGQDHLQDVWSQRVQVGDDRDTADQFRDQTEGLDVLGHDVLEQVLRVDGEFRRVLVVRAEAQRTRVEALGDMLLDAVEGAAADEQDVLGVFLFRLSSTLISNLKECITAAGQTFVGA